MSPAVDRDSARDAAARELADPGYGAADDSVLVKVLNRLGEVVDDLGRSGGPGVVGLVALVLLALAVAVVVRRGVGPVARTRRRARPVFAGEDRSAADHRAAAEEALAAGRVADAVRERFRAVTRELEERGVLDARVQRTVDEVAAEAGRELPDRAADFHAAARVFDDVWYGGRPATAEGYRVVAALDERVSA
ncbi:DUF4129 domain-containing protein [Saccharothrix syringae]|uniref:DUF4129 domain-containing protein n=1 Tax=Saccharothrix syringae TaxID=103733 RepID=A0A5Q0H521_SACSY|nr:DUF4129 domain-containing protein [Saccharothrix syringae]QFZ21034.1 DUF4129 domain-containing protein [Saccharothrix syringae]